MRAKALAAAACWMWLACACVCAFSSSSALPARGISARRMLMQLPSIDVEFPGGKKVKATPGEKFKQVTKRARFSPNYGCEEGICGSCEMNLAGKKVRVCVARVPMTQAPLKLENL